MMVWVGLTRAGVVLGPHFIERNLDSREHLRVIRYNVIQRDFLIHNIDRHVMWWQQDGAPCHTSNATMQYLRGQFPGRLMGKRGDWPWPHDLLIWQFVTFFFGAQTIWNVQRDQQPRNLRELREAIVSSCESLGQEMIQNAFDGMISRAQRCILAQGHAFPDE